MLSGVTTSLIGRRYQLLNELGSGSMGRLYRAIDHLTGRTIALKQVTIPTDQLFFATRNFDDEGSDLNLALAQEFKTLASLHHPNIIGVLDYGFDRQQQPFFTMELQENAQTLLEAGRGRPLSVKVDLLVQLLQALIYLHRRGVIHRDLKPGNVLVTNNQVKVVDFGLAVKGANPETESAGTLAYMAPEILHGQPAGQASDLYAVGVMSYELFAGKHPFNLTSLTLLIQDILYANPDFKGIDPALAQVLERALSKSPDDRYEQAADFINALGQASHQSITVETTSIRESFLQSAGFIGREREMNQLSLMLRQAQTGRGVACLVMGESGVGKSRLLDELRTLALVNGMLVLRGQGISEGGKPYQLWRDPLRWLCLQTDIGDLEASVLKVLVPDIGMLLGREVADAPELEAQPTQERLLTVIVDVFRRQQQPILMILEDLHWARESLDVLARLVVAVPELPLMIVGSGRDDERADLPALLPGTQVLKLGRLSLADIADLGEAVLGPVGRRPEVVELLNRETEGNPFFIVEVLRVLAEEAQGLERIGTRALPANIFAGGIRLIVQRRLQSVPESARPLLNLAAIAGRQLDLALLQQLVPDTGLQDWLVTCANAFVFELYEENWRFTHDKLREGVLVELSAAESQRLHHQVADALEQLYADDESHTALLAYHLGNANDPGKEAHYSALAGEIALRNGAFQDCITLLERALALADSTSMSPAAAADIRQKLCEAYLAVGDLARMRSHSESALELLNYRIPKAKSALWPGIVWQILRQVRHRFVMDTLFRPLSQTPKPTPMLTAARLSERQAQIAYLFNEKALTLYHGFRGLNLVEHVGDASAEKARFYSTVGLITGLVPLHGVTRRFEELATRSIEATEDYDAESWVMLTRGIYNAGRGQWATGERCLVRGQTLAENIGSARRANECRNALTLPYLCTGRWDDCLKLCQELAQNAARFRDTQNQMWGLAYRARCLLMLGQPDEALPLLTESEVLFEKVFDNVARLEVLSVRLKYHLVSGDMASAQESAGQIRSQIAATSPTSFLLLDVYRDLAEFYLRQWETDIASAANRQQAQVACQWLRRFAGVFDIGKSSALLYDGLFLHLQGKPVPAQAQFEKAIATAQQLKMPYDEAMAHYHAGRFLPASDSQRREQLQQAAAIFERLGAEWNLEQARGALPE